MNAGIFPFWVKRLDVNALSKKMIMLAAAIPNICGFKSTFLISREIRFFTFSTSSQQIQIIIFKPYPLFAYVIH